MRSNPVPGVNSPWKYVGVGLALAAFRAAAVVSGSVGGDEDSSWASAGAAAESTPARAIAASQYGALQVSQSVIRIIGLTPPA